MLPNPLGHAARSTVETLERRLLLHAEFGAFINFQPPDAPVPDGYLPDYGDAFGLHANGFSYGWDQHNYEARNRRAPGFDTRYRTINYTQLTGNRTWEIAVPENGVYAVKLVTGDGQYIGGRMQMRVEGMIALSDRITAQRPYIEATAVVNVTDGRLTLTNGPKALQNKIAFVEVTSFHGSVVNIKATQPIAAESGQIGTARVTRMGDLSQPLVVQYTVEGTAVAGQDYEPLTGTVTIPAGRSFANINIVPIDNGQTTGDRSLTVRITATDDYQLGDLQAAGITIRDDGTDTGPAPTLPPVTRINFQPDGTTTAPFYRVDTGAAYGVRSNGLTYGWSADNTAEVRDRASATGDRRYDTFNHMQKSADRFWEIAVPNGNYAVRVVAGDPSNFDSVYRINVENVPTVIGTPNSGNRFVEGTQQVLVLDGKLTISNGSGASNNKIAFIEITTGTSALPVVSVSTPVSTTQEGSATPGRVRFTRTGDTSAALLVSYAVAGNATPGVDYTPLTGTLTIPAGQTFADVLVSSIDDNAIESNETVSLKLNPSESYSSTLQQQGVVTIIDNDAPASNTINWSNTNGPATVYSETLSAVVNGKWYLFGGFPNSFQPVKISYVFDPNTNTYTRIADMPEAITHAPAVVDGTKVYIMGGYVGKDTGGQTFGSNKIWVYDTVANTWSAGPNLPQPRAGGGGALLGRYLHYFGGETLNRTADVTTHWRIDLDNIAGGWQTMAAMPQARNHLSAIVYDNKIYALGGQTGFDGGLTARSDMWSYDPGTNTWTPRASLPGVRSHFSNAMFITGGRLFVFGGETAHATPMRSSIVYDFASNSWSNLSLLPQNRMSAAVTYLNGSIYVVGGYNGSVATQAWRGTFA